MLLGKITISKSSLWNTVLLIFNIFSFAPSPPFFYASLYLSNSLFKLKLNPVQGFPPSEPGNQLTPADLIRSVNKKVRHNYIRRRLKVNLSSDQAQQEY